MSWKQLSREEDDFITEPMDEWVELLSRSACRSSPAR